MKKLFDTIFLTANQRIRSPFFGSFIFSWFIFNWKPILYFLFSGDKVSYKISIIESSYESIANATYRPLILSLIYVILFPYINNLIHILTTKAEKSKRIVSHKLKKEEIENSQELAEEEKKLEDIRSGNKDISQLNEKVILLNEENSRLKETIQDKDEIIGDYGEQLDTVTSESQKTKKELLEERNKKVLIFEDKVIESYKKFEKTKSYRDFLDISEKIILEEKPGESLKESINEYFDFDIIEKSNKDSEVYVFTKKGKLFFDLYSIFFRYQKP